MFLGLSYASPPKGAGLSPYASSYARRLLAQYLLGNVAGWLAGWLDVTRRYCIKTAKPIQKLFRTSGSRVILVSSDPAPIPNSNGNPLTGTIYIRGGENWRFSTEIAFYLGSGAREANGYYGTLIGSRWLNCIIFDDLE